MTSSLNCFELVLQLVRGLVVIVCITSSSGFHAQVTRLTPVAKVWGLWLSTLATGLLQSPPPPSPTQYRSSVDRLPRILLLIFKSRVCFSWLLYDSISRCFPILPISNTTVFPGPESSVIVLKYKSRSAKCSNETMLDKSV